MTPPPMAMGLSKADSKRLNDLLAPIDAKLLDLDKKRSRFAMSMFARWTTTEAIDATFDNEAAVLEGMFKLQHRAARIVADFVPEDPLVSLTDLNR